MVGAWDRVAYHGRYNRYPFTEVVSFVLGRYGSASPEERAGVSVLDLGCGGAHHLLFLAAEGFDYYGVDGSTESVDIARERMAAFGHDPSRVVLAPLDALPYDDGTFDVVIDRGSLTCNPLADLPPLYDEVHRVLRTGGHFFSMMLHRDSTLRSTGRDLGDGDHDELGGRLAGSGLLHFTDTEEQRRLLHRFEVVTLERSARTVEVGDSAGQTVAWSISTCRKA